AADGASRGAGAGGARGAAVDGTPMTVSSVTPASGSSTAPGSAPITVTFSDRLAATATDPTLSPSIPGSWARTGSHVLTFTPIGAYLPGTQVTVTIPGGRRQGVRALDGARLASTVTDQYTVGPGSVERLQQLLSLLDYSPLAWAPTATAIPASDTAAQQLAIFSPPAGSFTWRNTGWPTSLTSLWQEGNYNVFTQGLVMEFQADHGLTVNGTPSVGLWNDLLTALTSNQVNTGGYNYAVASKVLPETLTIWANGQQVFQSLANTGIPSRPTDDGTFPVYSRLRNQVMQGTNPNGTPYADPVQFVAYFNGGDAVHYIPRATYGSPQSLGCVELPLAQAAQAWGYLAYGTLVTVTG
ncbi:MAG: L,D-transpeptidase family protein, partial [Acidimicrobiales bacterium]